MGPLLFVNWHTVNVRFIRLMWLAALVLAIVIIIHSLPDSTTPPQPARGTAVLAAGLRGKP